jgi:hypothetical protein
MGQPDMKLVVRLLHFGGLISEKVDGRHAHEQLRDVRRNGVAVERNGEVEGTVRFSHVLVADLGESGVNGIFYSSHVNEDKRL